MASLSQVRLFKKENTKLLDLLIDPPPHPHGPLLHLTQCLTSVAILYLFAVHVQLTVGRRFVDIYDVAGHEFGTHTKQDLRWRRWQQGIGPSTRGLTRRSSYPPRSSCSSPGPGG